MVSIRSFRYAFNHFVRLIAVLMAAGIFASADSYCAGTEIDLDWLAKSPRDEIRPQFSITSDGSPSHGKCLVITHEDREGLDGWFQKTFEVVSGETYRFEAFRKTSNVVTPRRSALVRILWQDQAGKLVSANVPETQVRELGHTPTAEPEHPVDGKTDENGWTSVTGVYRVPSDAVRAVVELHLQWAPGGSVRWGDIQFAKSDAIVPRPVRIAAIHYKPSGKSPHDNCAEYERLIADAASEKADLVVMGETIPSVGVALKPDEIAESVPGPTTNYFGTMAKTHAVHLVLSLYERDQHLVYNTGVLIGPAGNLIGKYRKVCLPHSEVEKGVAPGSSYPVFDTTFGKVGIMVCYDGFFPEVARELANNGAEVIAWPVWGCNPLLAQARACENHVCIASSTFMAPKDGWMYSAIFDQTGKPIIKADVWGTVVVAEVDLNRPYIGPWNLGDFHSMIPRHRPIPSNEQNVE